MVIGQAGAIAQVVFRPDRLPMGRGARRTSWFIGRSGLPLARCPAMPGT